MIMRAFDVISACGRNRKPKRHPGLAPSVVKGNVTVFYRERESIRSPSDLIRGNFNSLSQNVTDAVSIHNFLQ